MTKTELLARVPLFKELGHEELERVASVARTESFAAETNIVEIGAPGHSLYLLIEGHVQVLYPARSDDFELARLGPGDFFGEMALLNDMPRSATVRSLEPVTALVLGKEDLRRLLLKSPMVALKLLDGLSGRIRNADEQISGLSDQVVRDALTGLQNRRAFHDRLAEECDRVRRYGEEFALIMLDVDNFKSINDTFGHDVGDQVLTWLGRLLTEHTRGADTPFRVGGEEFAILCPSTAVAVAPTVAARMVQVIGQAKPSVPMKLKVTVSAGYACCPEHGTTPEKIYHVADQALYQAKFAGRNFSVGPQQPPRIVAEGR